MNKEEKKALETFKHWIEYEKNNKEKINKADELINIQECILGIIKKQQKEIEKLQKEIERLKEREDYARLEKEQLLKDTINKDKIREIISKYVDIEEHLVYHHQELWGVDLAEMIKELLGE